MLSCLAFGVGEILLIIACVALVAAVIGVKIYSLVKGKRGCSGNCGCCLRCSHSKDKNQRGDVNKQA